jgi:hypothetical protein
MTHTPADTRPPLGLWSRAVGIIFSPGETFSDVVRSPRPVGILFLVALVTGLAASGPQFTERGRLAVRQMQIEQTERMTGRPLAPEQQAQMEQMASYGSVLTLVSTFVGLPIFSLVLSAIFWALFNVVLGGMASFKHVLGIVTHSQVIFGLSALLSAPVLLMQERWSPYGPFNLGALVPMLEPSSLVAATLSSMTFFGVWQCIVLGIGLAVLYGKRSTGPVLTLLGFYLVVALGFGMVSSMILARS